MKTLAFSAVCMLAAVGAASAQSMNGQSGQSGRTSTSEAQARAEAMGKCANVSTLSRDNNGTWHGNCQKGGRTMAVTVESNGQVALK